MGACTSRHEVLKNAGEAPLPIPANEESEVIKEEVITENQEEVPPAAADGDEAKRQSLGNLFKESEEENITSFENTSELVKQEDVKPQEEFVDVVETEKEVVIIEAYGEDKTVLAEASDEKKAEEKPDDMTTKPETSSEKAEEEKSEEKKTDEKSEIETTEEEHKTTASDEKKPLFKLWF